MSELKSCRKALVISLLAALTIPLFFISALLCQNDLVCTLRLICTYLFLIPAAYIDHKQRIIPNRLLPVGLAISLVFISVEVIAGGVSVLTEFLSSLLGLFIGGGVFALAAFISRGGVGMGDIKLFGVLGFMLRARYTYSMVFFTLLCASMYSVYMLAAKKANLKTRVAAAPFALAGMAVAIIAGG